MKIQYVAKSNAIKTIDVTIARLASGVKATCGAVSVKANSDRDAAIQLCKKMGIDTRTCKIVK